MLGTLRSRILQLLHRGWRVLTEAHTALWVLGVMGISVPPTIGTGLLFIIGEHSAAFLSMTFAILAAATVLISLAALGGISERQSKCGLSPSAGHSVSPPMERTAGGAPLTISAQAHPVVAAPLPANAHFQLDGRVFWHVKHQYARQEAVEILNVAEALDNYLLSEMIKAVDFVHGFVAGLGGLPFTQIISEMGGGDASEKLRKFDVELLIPAYQKAMDIMGRYPTHRGDIADILAEGGSFGAMRGDLHALQNKLKILPSGASDELIGATSNSERQKFLDGLGAFRRMIGDFHQRLDFMKPELRFLSERR